MFVVLVCIALLFVFRFVLYIYTCVVCLSSPFVCLLCCISRVYFVVRVCVSFACVCGFVFVLC